MKKLGVIFGSRSAEHEISIISGLQILENADKSKYDAFPIYISKDGEWFVGEPLRDIKNYKTFDPSMKGITKVILPPVPGMNGLYALSQGGLFKKSAKICELDCAILALHGMHGEDGCVQGLLELADIPYTSSGLVGSAVGMDKIVMKSVFYSMGIPVLDSIYCYRSEWKKNREDILDNAEKLGYPLYVKPANLGSSIGISKAVDRETLEHAVDVASAFDRRIVIEKGIEKPIEINCACIGFDGEVTPSVCEEPIAWDEFLTFDDKYTRGGKGMKGAARKIPAPISDELTDTIRDYTAKIFRMLECKGVVRVDYMIDPATEKIYVCEINTIPGSFAFYLFEPMGIKFKQLVDMLVEYAYAAYEQKKESTYAYSSDVINKSASGQRLPKYEREKYNNG